VVGDSDPARLPDKLREASQGRDVHLVGGPRTFERERALPGGSVEIVYAPRLSPRDCPTPRSRYGLR